MKTQQNKADLFACVSWAALSKGPQGMSGLKEILAMPEIQIPLCLFSADAAFLLAVGSFLLTVELFYLQLTALAFLLTVGAFLLTALALLLTVGAFLLTVGKCV